MAGQFIAEQYARNRIEFVLPHRTVVGRFLQRAQMRQFMDQRFETVMASIASDQNSLAARQRDPTDLPAMYALDHGLAHQVHLPAGRHRVRPNSRPGLPGNFGDVL